MRFNLVTLANLVGRSLPMAPSSSSSPSASSSSRLLPQLFPTMQLTVIITTSTLHWLALATVLLVANISSCRAEMTTNESSLMSDSAAECLLGYPGLCNADEFCLQLKPTTRSEERSMMLKRVTARAGPNWSPDLEQRARLDEQLGTCQCRLPAGQRCRRELVVGPPEATRIMPHSNASLQHLDDTIAHRTTGSLCLIIGLVVGLTVLSVGGFAVYYYGFRYGMIPQLARQLGLTDNTQVEHQLLNRIPTPGEDDTELAI